MTRQAPLALAVLLLSACATPPPPLAPTRPGPAPTLTKVDNGLAGALRGNATVGERLDAADAELRAAMADLQRIRPRTFSK